MANKITLKQLQELATQLTPQEQIELIANVSARLSRLRFGDAEDENGQEAHSARIEAFLKMVDEKAAETVGEVNAAEDIRQIREQRTTKL